MASNPYQRFFQQTVPEPRQRWEPPEALRRYGLPTEAVPESDPRSRWHPNRILADSGRRGRMSGAAVLEGVAGPFVRAAEKLDPLKLIPGFRERQEEFHERTGTQPMGQEIRDIWEREQQRFIGHDPSTFGAIQTGLAQTGSYMIPLLPHVRGAAAVSEQVGRAIPRLAGRPAQIAGRATMGAAEGAIMDIGEETPGLFTGLGAGMGALGAARGIRLRGDQAPPRLHERPKGPLSEMAELSTGPEEYFRSVERYRAERGATYERSHPQARIQSVAVDASPNRDGSMELFVARGDEGSAVVASRWTREDGTFVFQIDDVFVPEEARGHGRARELFDALGGFMFSRRLGREDVGFSMMTADERIINSLIRGLPPRADLMPSIPPSTYAPGRGWDHAIIQGQREQIARGPARQKISFGQEDGGRERLPTDGLIDFGDEPVNTPWRDQLTQLRARFYDEMFNSQAPIERIGEAMGTPELRYALQERRGVTEAANAVLEFGNFKRTPDGKFVTGRDGKLVTDTRGYWEILADAPDRRDFSHFVASQSDLERANRGMKATMPEESAATIRSLRKRYGETTEGEVAQLSDLAREWRDYTIKTQLDPLVDVGVLSRQDYERILAANDFHAPMREIKELGKVYDATLQGTLIRAKGGFKEGKKIADPLQEAALRTVAVQKYFADQHLKRQLVRKGGEFVRLARPSTPKEGRFTVYEDGKPIHYEAPDGVLKALESMSPDESGLLWSALHGISRTMRAGAVLAPGFSLVFNILRDQINHFVYTPIRGSYIPFISMLDGLGEMIGRGEWYRDFKAAGVAQVSRVSPDREFVNSTLRNLTGDGRDWTRYINVIDWLREVGYHTETASRIGAWKRIRKAGQSFDEARDIVRDIPDYMRAGEFGGKYNQITAFFNVAMQDLDKAWRTFGRDVYRAAKGDRAARDRAASGYAKAFAAITLPTMYLWQKNRNDPDYQRLQNWEKDIFWHWGKVNLADPDEHLLLRNPAMKLMLQHVEGTTYWFRTPKPFGAGHIFGTLPEIILDKATAEDPESTRSIVEMVNRNMMPNIMPTGIAPIVENVADYDFFLQRPLEGRFLRDIDPELRYRQYTPHILRKAGETAASLGIASEHVPGGEMLASPIQLENILYGYTATLGKGSVEMVDELLYRAGAWGERPDKQIAPDRLPLIGRVLQRVPEGARTSSYDEFRRIASRVDKLARSVNREYRAGRPEEAERRMERYPEMQAARMFRRYTNSINDMMTERRRIENDMSLGGQSRAQEMRRIDQEITSLVEEALKIYREEFGEGR